MLSLKTNFLSFYAQIRKKDKIPEVVAALRAARSFVRVVPVEKRDIDNMLATVWEDPEDGLFIELALKMRADAIISRDEDFPHPDFIPVFSCEEFWNGSNANTAYPMPKLTCKIRRLLRPCAALETSLV